MYNFDFLKSVESQRYCCLLTRCASVLDTVAFVNFA